MRHARSSALKHVNTTVYSPYGESLHDQLTVCLRMSNHYRRVYSCKTAVDTSAPCTFGLRRSRRVSSRNPADQPLVEAIVYDTTKSPSTYRSCYGGGNRGSANHNPTKSSPKDCTLHECKQPQHHAERRAYLPQRPVGAFKQPRSKPPPALRSNNILMDKWQLEEPVKGNVRSHSAQSDAKTSSGDSAYSGGVSSSRESCSLTLGQRQDDIRYTRFIHEITQDVLRRGVFTDKGLQLLFQRHIDDHQSVLNKDRMEKEVAKLARDLGILDQDQSTGREQQETASQGDEPPSNTDVYRSADASERASCRCRCQCRGRQTLQFWMAIPNKHNTLPTCRETVSQTPGALFESTVEHVS